LGNPTGIALGFFGKLMPVRCDKVGILWGGKRGHAYNFLKWQEIVH
jgi:hypothetical protein